MKRLILLVILLIIGKASFAASDIFLISQYPQPGRCFEVKVKPESGVKIIAVHFLGRKIAGYGLRAIVGIPPEQKPGGYDLKVVLKNASGGQEEINQILLIKKKTFPKVSFWLKPAKHKLLQAKDLIADEWSRVEKVLMVETPEQAWQGEFTLPVSGEVSMLFGTKEYVNRRPRSQHRGMDLAVPLGTKVSAANDGTVVFADKLTAFGGTLVIDHGQGVFSLYFHLSKFLARPGNKITKGQLVALSGNTGISSGPHLHWGMSVHDLRVDPLQWTEKVM